MVLRFDALETVLLSLRLTVFLPVCTLILIQEPAYKADKRARWKSTAIVELAPRWLGTG